MNYSVKSEVLQSYLVTFFYKDKPFHPYFICILGDHVQSDSPFRLRGRGSFISHYSFQVVVIFFVNCPSLSISNFPNMLIAMDHASIRCAGSTNYRVKKGPWFFLRHLLTKLKSDYKQETKTGTSFHFTYGCIDSGCYFFHLLRPDDEITASKKILSGLVLLLSYWRGRIDRACILPSGQTCLTSRKSSTLVLLESHRSGKDHY